MFGFTYIRCRFGVKKIGSSGSKTVSDDDHAPVGTVQAYAGPLFNHRVDKTKVQRLLGSKSYQLGKKNHENLLSKGWLKADGAKCKIAHFELLAATLGGHWGQGTDKLFELPDLRGYFLRGVTNLSSYQRDPDYNNRIADRKVTDSGAVAGFGTGSSQKDGNQKHSHSTPVLGGHGSVDVFGIGWDNNTHRRATIEASGGSEARPKNVCG